jgi:hypothetical protein
LRKRYKGFGCRFVDVLEFTRGLGFLWFGGAIFRSGGSWWHEARLPADPVEVAVEIAIAVLLFSMLDT